MLPWNSTKLFQEHHSHKVPEQFCLGHLDIDQLDQVQGLGLELGSGLGSELEMGLGMGLEKVQELECLNKHPHDHQQDYTERVGMRKGLL